MSFAVVAVTGEMKNISKMNLGRRGEAPRGADVRKLTNAISLCDSSRSKTLSRFLGLDRHSHPAPIAEYFLV